MLPFDSVCAGIVTYCPDIDLLKKNIQALMPQVAELFIVDNCSSNIHEIMAMAKQINGGVRVECNKENFGIAKALNQLCLLAKEHNYEWILTMDQDSVCSPDMVYYLLLYIDNPYLGIIAPRVEFRDGDCLITSTKNGDKETIEVPACISSGSLTRVSAWEKVGGFDEWFFIDVVDNEFCAHLKVFDYRVLRVNKAILYQKAGKMKYLRIPFLGTILLPYYNATRNYYICRNTFFYLRKYHRYIRVRHELFTFIYSQLIKLFFEENRLVTVKSVCKGVYDGIRKEVTPLV